MKCTVYISLLFLLFWNTGNSFAQKFEIDKESKIFDSISWAEKMAKSIMKTHQEAWQIDDRENPRWDYVHGLVLTSFEKLFILKKDSVYYFYLKQYADQFIDSSGNISTYKIEDYNLDMINAGKLLFHLYNNSKSQNYLKAMNLLRRQLNEQPRTKEGGFWHKKRYPNQMWLDGLYMQAPFYARYTNEFENGKNLNDVALQFELIQKHSFDKKTGLPYHGWDESMQMPWADKKSGCSPSFWSRSIGWYAMALVDVLDYFPESHPKRKKLIRYLNQLAFSLAKYQDKSGLWFQVTDQGNREGNYLEATGSDMFAYAFAKGVNKGYLPLKYRQIANKAFDGLVNQLIVKNADGTIKLINCCAVAGLGGNPYRDGSFDYYVSEKRKDNDPKGTGPFILAAIELGR